MSLCVMLQSKVGILIASDTAYSVKIGEETYRVSNDGRKLFQFGNEVMFCSGTIEYVNALIPLVEMNGTRINKTKLRDSVEKLVPKDTRVELGEPAHLEIIIAGIENGESYICEMREVNDYKIVNFVADQEGTRIVTAGLKEAGCNGIAYMEFFKSPGNYHDFYVNTYKRMACEEISGKIDAYLISETGVDKVISHYDLYDGYKIAKDQPWYNDLIETGVFQEMKGLKDKPIVHAIVTAWANSTFGPWVVGDLSIYRGSYDHATQGGMYFGVAGLSVSNQFVVDANGYLTATGSNISGTINAAELKVKEKISLYSFDPTTNKNIFCEALSGVTIDESFDTLVIGGEFMRTTISSYTIFNEGLQSQEGISSKKAINSETGFYRNGTSVSYTGHTHTKIVNNDGESDWLCSLNGNLIPRTKEDGGTDMVDTPANVGNSNGYVANLYYEKQTKVSDKRRKIDLGDLPLDETLSILKGSIPKKFLYKRTPESGIQYGMYAQDVRDLLISNNIGYASILQINHKNEEATPITDINYPESEVNYGLEYEQYIPLLIKGWQYQNKEIEELKSKIQAQNHLLQLISQRLEVN